MGTTLDSRVLGDFIHTMGAVAGLPGTGLPGKTVSFTGSSDADVDAASLTFRNVEIAKSGGTLTFLDDLSVQRNFTYISGTVDLSAVTVRFVGPVNSVVSSGALHFGDVVVDKPAPFAVNFQGVSIVDGDFTVEDTHTGRIDGTVELAGTWTCRARRTARARP